MTYNLELTTTERKNAVKAMMRADREQTLKWLIRSGYTEAMARNMVGQPEHLGDITSKDYEVLLDAVLKSLRT